MDSDDDSDPNATVNLNSAGDVSEPGEEPTKLGRFDLLSELGRGGMGLVYLAHDPHTKRLVALKVPAPAVLHSIELRARFAREAEMLARLDHPNIIPVYEADIATGIVYLAMAYCPGPNLADWLRLHPEGTSPHSAAWLIESIAQGISHAHSRGVIHRDLKPSNIMLFPAVPTASAESPLTEEWFIPKVSDFGLARRFDAATTLITATPLGTVMGSIAFMAPEQAEGRGRDTDPRTDVYALGAVLYTLLANQPPFDALDPASFRLILQDPPPRPRVHGRLPPRDLESICFKCLEKNPDHRYATAAELAEDLARFRAGEPVLARPQPRRRRVIAWCKRRPAVALAWTGSVVALIVAVVVGIVVLRNLDRADQNVRGALHQASMLEFQAKLEGVTRRRLERSPGWPSLNLKVLQELASMDSAKQHPARLRGEAAHCFATPDLRRGRAVAKGFNAHSIAYSADGKFLALGEWYPTIDSRTRVVVVRLSDGQIIQEFRYDADQSWEKAVGRADGCQAVAFSPRGDTLAAGSRSGRVFLWDLARPAAPPTLLKGHTRTNTNTDTVEGLLFDANAPVLLSCNGHETIGWDLNQRGIRRYFLPQVRLPHGLNIADGRVAGKLGTDACHIDTVTGKVDWLAIYWGDHTVTASPDADLIGLFSGPRLVLVPARERANTRPLRRADEEYAESSTISDAAFSPDGSLLASTSTGLRLTLWSVGRMRRICELPIEEGSRRMAFAPGGRQIAVCSHDRVTLFDIIDGGIAFAGPRSPLPVMDFDSDGNRVALSAHGDRHDNQQIHEISLWSRNKAGRWHRDGRQTEVAAGFRRVDLLALQTPGVVYLRDDALLKWEGGENEPRHLVDVPVPGVSQFRAADDGRLWGVSDSAIFGWPPKRTRARTSPVPFTTLAVRPGQVLAGRRDGKVLSYVPNSVSTRLRRVSASAITALTTSSKNWAAGDEAGGVTVWQSDSDEPIVKLPQAHAGKVTTLSLSHDLLATGSIDQTVKLWGLDGSPLLRLEMSGPVHRLWLNPSDDQLLVLVEGERTLVEYRLDELRRQLEAMGLSFEAVGAEEHE